MKFLKPLFFLLIFLIPFELYKVELLRGIISLRPYQIVTAVLLVLIGYYSVKGKIKIDELRAPFRSSITKLFAVFFLVSIISIANALDVKNSIQETLVLLSFLAIYWLVLFFVRSKNDMYGMAHTLLVSSFLVSIFALVQVIAYKFGLELIEVMPGRPNSFFPEPDWLGFFMVFALALFISVHGTRQPFLDETMFHAMPSMVRTFHSPYVHVLFQVLLYIVIILTIARASWLAAIGVTGLYLLLMFLNKENHFRSAFLEGGKMIGMVLISLGIIYALSLTPFSLKNRFLSIVTGQEVHAVVTDPETGKEISIDKKRIEDYKKKGVEVKTRRVEDVNILRRTESFTDNFDIVLKHPFLGIGFGGIENAFGEGVNANNIFMEIWIATGTLGLIVFMTVFYCIVREWCVLYFKNRSESRNVYLLFVILGLVAIVIPNIFNSGIFLGFFWVYLGLASSILFGGWVMSET